MNLYLLSLLVISVNSIPNVTVYQTIRTYDIQIAIPDIINYISLEIDLQNKFSYFAIQRFTKEYKDTLHVISEKDITIHQKEQKASLIQFDLHFFQSSLSIKPINFYMFHETLIDSYDALSLSFDFNDENESLVQLMYNKKIIKKKSFALLHENKNKCTLYFGVFPMFNYYQYKGQCLIQNNEWSCKLHKIILRCNSDKIWIYQNTKSYTAKFQTRHRELYVPKHFFDYLLHQVFRDAFKQGYCYINIKFQLLCSLGYLKELFNGMSFVFDGFTVTMKIEDLYIVNGKDEIFMIQMNENNRNEFEFGVDFLKHFDLYFNYEDKSITFYTNFPIIKREGGVNEESQVDVVKIIIINIIELVVSSILLIITKY